MNIFVGCNHIITFVYLQLLAVLSQDGILRFIDTNNCILKAEIGDQQQVCYHQKQWQLL